MGMEDSLRFYDTVLNKNLIDENAKKQVLLRKARLYKRNKNYKAAIPLWEQALSDKGFLIEPYEELAKTYEHHLQDPGKAKEYTERALNNLSLLEQLYPERMYYQQRNNLTWRLQRLSAKLQRAQR